MKSRTHAHHAKSISRLLLGFLLILLPLALGGGRPLTNAVASISALLGLSYLALARQTNKFYGSTAIFAMSIATISTAIQLIPIPTSWLEILSPAALNLRYGIENSIAPITLDPPATYHELTKMLLYLACAILAASLCRSLKWRKNLLWAIAASGVVIVLVGILHKILGWQLTYNQFGAPDKVLPTSFINENHLAGFLGFVSISTLGLAFSSIKRQAISGALMSIICATGVFLSLSRAGTVLFAMFLSVTIPSLFMLHKRNKHNIHISAKSLLLIGTGVVGIIIIIASILPLAVHKQLHTLTRLSELAANKKWVIWEPFSQMFREFWISGGGKGAFVSYYPYYSKLPTNLTYTHFENIIAQTLVDFGAMMGTLTLLAFVYTWLKAFQLRRNSATDVAPLLGIAFLFVHNLVDFSFEMTAVGLPVILILSAWTAPGKKESKSSTTTNTIRGRTLLGGSIAGLLISSYSSYQATNFELRHETEVLSESLANIQVPNEIIKLAKQATLHHPADYFIPFAVTWRLYELEGPSTRTRHWLNRALYLGPTFPRAHILAGRILIQLGAVSQAMVEYRLAIKHSPKQVLNVAEEIYSKTKNIDLIAKLDPPNFESSIRLFRFLLEKNATESAYYVFLNSTLKDEPLQYETQIELANLRMKQGNTGEAIKIAQAAQSASPEKYKSYLFLSRAYEQTKQNDLAFSELQKGLSSAHNSEKILIELCTRKIAHGKYNEAFAAANKLIKYGTQKSYKNGELLKAKIYTKIGKRIEALRIYEKWRNKYPWKANYRQWIIEIRLSINDLKGAQAEIQDAKRSGMSKPGLLKLTNLIKAKTEKPKSSPQ